jgi:hypothetical protein
LAKGKINWLEIHKRAAKKKPWIRLDRFAIKSRRGEIGYDVVIAGFNLRSGAIPPLITVGGITVERLKFERAGRVIRGFLPAAPPNEHLVVDFRIVRAEITGQAS